jgi:hypothetical protein
MRLNTKKGKIEGRRKESNEGTTWVRPKNG